MNTTTATPRNAAVRRGNATYRLMRQLHLWIGAWGALAAVLYGFTGLVMNHRFGENAWPQGKSEEAGRVVLEVPTQARTSPEALSDWLRTARGLDTQTVRKGRGGEARLAGRPVREPAAWMLSGGKLDASWSLEYVPGNATAEVKQSRHGVMAVVMRLHKAVGGGAGWILLADSFAVGMLLLGLSGLWMWARGRDLRRVVASVLGASVAATLLVFLLA